MSLEGSKLAFINILNSLDTEQRPKFLSWIRTQWCSDPCASKAYFDLRTIAQDIKTMVPMNAIFDSEKVLNPYNMNGTAEPVFHVDSFLFDDEDIDTLVEEGKLSRNYCRECGSTNVSPITFISHSVSIERIIFIFQYLLPNLNDKVLLDVGSRLGAVLYGAYYCSHAKKIIGVEFNDDLCKLQRLVAKKYSMDDRIEVICSDIRNVPDVVNTADVIVLNNVFECFLPEEEQTKTWLWLRNNVRKHGTVLVTVPSLEESISKLQIDINMPSWVQEIPIKDPVAKMKMEEQDLLSEIHLYMVL